MSKKFNLRKDNTKMRGENMQEVSEEKLHEAWRNFLEKHGDEIDKKYEIFFLPSDWALHYDEEDNEFYLVYGSYSGIISCPHDGTFLYFGEDSIDIYDIEEWAKESGFWENWLNWAGITEDEVDEYGLDELIYWCFDYFACDLQKITPQFLEEVKGE